MVMGFSRYSNIYLNDSNDQEAKPYSVLNFRIGNEFQIYGSRLKIHVGVNNVLNEDYYSNLRVNAWGGRFYEPAPLANLYLGAEIIF